MYGRYGTASGVNPSICFPLKEELDDRKEYERVAFPQTIPQMIAEAKQKRQEIEDRKMQRQKDIVEKMKKLEQWKKDLFNRIEKKENEVRAAKVSTVCYLLFNFSVRMGFFNKTGSTFEHNLKLFIEVKVNFYIQLLFLLHS